MLIDVQKLRWAVFGIIIVLPIAGGIVAIKVLQFKAMGAASAQQVIPPEPVNVAEVREERWQPRVSAVGSVMAFQGTVVSAEAEGVVREIKFEAGSVVKAGDELVQLDVEIEQAQLRAAEAAAEWARVSFKRAKELIASRSISQAELDSADASLKQANAQVDNIRAVIAKKTVRAPFAGKLGIRRISVGQFLEKGSPVVSLQSLDPVYVEFSLPQQRLGELTEGLKVAVSSDSYPGQQFEGKITAVNPEIDHATRNVRVQATLANGDGRLRPGMFVSVDMILARSEKVLFIPATAVLHAPFGDSVFRDRRGPGWSGRNETARCPATVRASWRATGRLCRRDRRRKGRREDRLHRRIQTPAGNARRHRQHARPTIYVCAEARQHLTAFCDSVIRCRL